MRNVHPWSAVSFGLALVLSLGILVGFAGCGGRRAEQARVLGDTYLNLNNLPEARKQYQASIASDPKNALAHLGLARCAAAEDKIDEAVAQYRETVSVNPSVEEAFVEAVRLLLGADRAGEAEAIAKSLAARNTERGGLLEARVLIQSKRQTDGLKLLEALREQFPKSAQVRVDLALAHHNSGSNDKAKTELSAVLSDIDKGHLPARLLLSDVRAALGKGEEALQEAKADVAADPSDANAGLSLANALITMGQPEDAERTAMPILQNAPESGWANYVVGRCYAERGQSKEAESYLRKASRVLADQPLVAQRLASVQEKRGGAAGSPQAAAQPFAPASPPPTTAIEPPMLGEPITKDWRGLWLEAGIGRLMMRRDEFLATGDPDVVETLALAALFSGQAAIVEEIGAKLPSGSPVASFLAAIKSIEANRRSEEAIRELRNVLDKWTEESSSRRLLRENAEGFALSLVGARAQAFSRFAMCLQRWPDNGVALYNLSNMYRAIRMPGYSTGCLRKLVSIHPDAIEARSLLLQSLLASNDVVEAQKQAEATFGLFPSEPQAIVELAGMYLQSSNKPLAIEVLNQGIKRNPDSAPLKLLLASSKLPEGEAQAALDLVASAKAGPGLALQALEVTAFAKAILNDWQGAIDMISSQQPSAYSPPVRLLYAAALIKVGRKDDAIKTLVVEKDDRSAYAQRAGFLLRSLGQEQQVSPSDAPLVDALAGKDALLGEFATALAMREDRLHKFAFDALVRVNTDLGAQPRLLGYMLEALSRSSQIVDREAIAKSIMDQAPSSAEVWLEYAQFHWLLKDTAAQREALNKAVEFGPDRPEVWFAMSVFAEQQKDLQLSLEATRKLAELQPENALVKNNLAYYILESKGDSNEALGIVQQAYEKMPNHPSVLHTLGLAQLRTNDLVNARKNLTMALELRPGDPTILLDVGTLLIKEGREEEGKSHVRLSLMYADQLGVEFSRRPEAEAIAPLPTAG